MKCPRCHSLAGEMIGSTWHCDDCGYRRVDLLDPAAEPGGSDLDWLAGEVVQHVRRRKKANTRRPWAS